MTTTATIQIPCGTVAVRPVQRRHHAAKRRNPPPRGRQRYVRESVERESIHLVTPLTHTHSLILLLLTKYYYNIYKYNYIYIYIYSVE